MFLPSNITLKFGDSGDFVAELQRRLAMVRCFNEAQVNGFYDGTTVNGVTQFQSMHGLHADGVAGPETLRRLNGVIAGDTSSATDSKNEEEEKRLAAEQVMNYTLAQVEPPSPAMWGGDPELPREEVPAVAAPQATFGPSPAALNIPQPEPAPPISQLPQPDAAAMAERAQREQPITQSNTQDLTAMLMAATQQQQPPQPAMPQPQELPAQPATPRGFGQRPPIEMQPPETLRPEPEPVREPMGVMQRVGRFASAMMQKLADYFEAKLPSSVLNEVRAAGMVMAQHGVREAPIPTGPDNVRAPEQLPARGPEQQPQQFR